MLERPAACKQPGAALSRALSARARRDKYAGGAGNATTRKELGALFAVIGTPSWADVDDVRSASWRSYLQRLPGKAPTLYRRLAMSAGKAGRAGFYCNMFCAAWQAMRFFFANFCSPG